MDIKLNALLAILLVTGLLLIPCPPTVEASSWLGDWAKRVQFTIDHNDIDENVTWFPVRLHLHTVLPTDVGDAATDRSTSYGNGFTIISKGNPVDANSTLTSVEIWATTNLTGCKVGIFYTTNGDTLKCRSAATIGSVTAGSKQTFTGLSLSMQTGDYIGIYYSHGLLERDAVGGSGLWTVTGDKCTVDNETTYTPVADAALSLYGEAIAVDVSCVFDEVGANSKKIAITKADGVTELYGEIEKWDSVNEEAEIHSSRDGWAISDSADTVGYLYYDNTHADNDAYIGDIGGRTEVWDGNFVGVWHLAESGDGTAGEFKDSTSNDNDGQGGAGDSAKTPDQIAAKIGYGQDFSAASADTISIADAASLDITAKITVEAWAFFIDASIFQPIVSKDYDGVSKAPYVMRYQQDLDKFQFYSYDSGTKFQVFGNAAPSDNTWYHFAGTFDESLGSNNAKSYEDGAFVEQASYTSPMPSNNEVLQIGRYMTRSNDNILDEVRISNDVRSAAWIKASYESERDHLITWGSEETPPTVGEITYSYIIG